MIHKRIIVRVLTGILLLSWGVSHAQKISGKPNVLLIYTDDQGTLDMNAYGAKDIHTPNMDELARQGVMFTQFYAASPVCSPSRASLMTGRYPQNAGLPGNASSSKGEPGMPGEQFTIAELFKSAGYATGHIGKWHMGFSTETMPNAQGFDHSFGHMGGCIDNYSHFFYWNGPNRHDLWRNGEEVWADGQYFPDLMVNESKLFLEKNRNRPFFLYLAFNLPHYPLQGEEKWRQRYADLPEPRRQYAAAVSTVDEKIGIIIKELKRLGLYEDTIIVFQSDHGHSEEERTFGGGGYAGGYRGAKFSLFEGGIRVPAVISWPAGLPKNQVRQQFGANVDWMPTLAELCNIKVSVPVDGKSLLPVILHDNKDNNERVFYWQIDLRGSRQWCVRQGPWKLLYNPVGGDSTEMGKDKFFLSNLEQNPGEDQNFADRNPAIVEKLKGLYEHWVRSAAPTGGDR